MDADPTNPEDIATASVAERMCAAAEKNDFEAVGRILLAAVALGGNREEIEKAFAAEAARRGAR